TSEQILEFFCGHDHFEPGLVQLDEWWPSGPPLRARYPEEQVMVGGVAYKPGDDSTGRRP
ncbi:MAG: hypothetical protein HOQ36_24890, partial [Nocardia sp.]|nr:hypothetical protein [Nocardia sp.]